MTKKKRPTPFVMRPRNTMKIVSIKPAIDTDAVSQPKKKKKKKVKAVRPTRAETRQELHERRTENSQSFRDKAERGLTRKAASTGDDLAILDCLTGKANWLSEPLASNLHHRDKIADLVSNAMLAKRAESPSLQIGHLTLLNEDWDTSAEGTDIDINRIMTDTRSAVNKLAPNSISVIESQMFANVAHCSGGALLSNHTHSLLWGVDIRSRAEAAVKKLQYRFRSSLDDVDGVKLEWVGPTDMDVIRVAHYPWKAPNRCKTLYKNVDTGEANLHQSEANDRFIRYLRMLQILSMLRTDRIMFGSGQGGSMRSDILREANSALRSGDKDRNPPIHSEGIPAYHIELMDRIGEHRFKLPIIKYRKK